MTCTMTKTSNTQRHDPDFPLALVDTRLSNSNEEGNNHSPIDHERVDLSAI